MKRKHLLKKALTALMVSSLTLTTALSFSGCGNKDTKETSKDSKVSEETKTSEETEKTEDDSSSDDGTIREALTALEFTELMGNGINLGNTMEAYGHGSLGTEASPTSYETLWGAPVTTQESIDGMKAAGFDTIRIPVAWTNMMDFESGDYTIDEAYLARVKEIVDYARNAGMYVIVNDHWDGGWWGMFGSKTEETRNKAMELYESLWTQIAEYFKDYSDYLIFESANEELGNRLNDNDSDFNKDSGSLSVDECYTVTNEINQKFVDIVRGTGGNNEQRFLLIAGFDTNIANTCDDRYKMPTDTAESKLMVSVHYYDPSSYCIEEALSTWGTRDNYEDQNVTLAKMKKFTDEGYGVVIGEYGVLLEDGTMKENTLDYYKNFIRNCDIMNFCPVLWDCNNLYDREAGKIIDDEIAQFYLDQSYESQAAKDKEQLLADEQNAMDEALAAAESGGRVSDDTAMAWIMFNSSDWNTIYSVGDVYDPVNSTAGIKAKDVKIKGEGTYKVGLDFTGISGGYANSTVFSALAISNGETLYPDYVIDIKKVEINGKKYKLKGKPYTCSDDGKCTRVNLYNGWVNAVPEDIRTVDGSKKGASPTVLDPETLGDIETIYITFKYGPAK